MSCYACMHSVPVSTVHPMALKWEVPLRGRGYVLSLGMEAKLADVEWMTPSHPLHIPPCSVTSHYTPGRCSAAIKRRCSSKEGAQVIIKGFLFGIPDVTQNAGGNFVYNDSSSQISQYIGACERMYLTNMSDVSTAVTTITSSAYTDDISDDFGKKWVCE